MNLYMKNGYVNMQGIMDMRLPFNLVIGGRGTGKTFTSLDVLIASGRKFMLMRRTQTQADIISRAEFSPLKPLEKHTGKTFTVEPITKYNSAFYELTDTGEVDNEGKTVYEKSQAIAYTCALSTISRIRGFDSSEIEVLLYDEFIPESHERPIKNEGKAFLNAYETINRNRELQGRDPLQCVCLANSDNLANELFLEMGIVHQVENASRKGKTSWIDKKRGIGVFLLTDSPISAAKKETALYKLSEGSEFSEMSLANKFGGASYENIVSRPLSEYSPLVSVGEITIYKHKNRRELYITTHYSGSPPKFGVDTYSRQRFKLAWGWIWGEYLCQRVKFEEVLCEILLTKYFN